MKDSLVDDFLRSSARRFQPGTIQGYMWALFDWERYIDGKPPSEWRPRDLEGWQDEMAGRGVKPRSRQLATSAMRSMLRWAARMERDVPANLYQAVETVRVPRLLPKPIDPVHLQRLLTYLRPERQKAPIAYWRDRALFVFLLQTGARVSEALQLQVADTLDRGTIVRQKGGSSKVLWAPPTAQLWTEQYLARRWDEHPALWVTRGSAEHSIRRMSAAGVRCIWQRLAERVGVPPFTSHMLRHTCATELSDSGVGDEVIADWLGHASTSTVPIYRQIRMGRRSEAWQAMEEVVNPTHLPAGVLGVAFKNGQRRTPLL